MRSAVVSAQSLCSTTCCDSGRVVTYVLFEELIAIGLVHEVHVSKDRIAERLLSSSIDAIFTIRQPPNTYLRNSAAHQDQSRRANKEPT